MKLIILALFILFVFVIDFQQGLTLPQYREKIGLPLLLTNLLIQLLLFVFIVYILSTEVTILVKAGAIVVSILTILAFPKYLMKIKENA